MPTITPKQKAILDYIADYIKKNQYSPTLKEIAKHFKRSQPTIAQYVKTLEKRGLLKKEKGMARGISLFVDPSTYIHVHAPKKIGIIGYGMVGQAVQYGFSNEEIHIYDKYKESESLKEVVEGSDYIFICLPTPIKSNGSGIDLTIINESIRKIVSFSRGSDKIIIIKSTVIPGTTKKYIQKYKKSLFCFNPEFLTERAFLQDFVNTDRVIIGTENSSIFRRVSSLYQKILPKVPIFQTDTASAEMVKYMTNCFLATKVIFANEMSEICQKLGVEYEEVKKMIVADSRIFDSHLDITTLRGFGGKCFPKDLLALTALAKKKKVDTKILDAVWSKNLKIRKVHDWEEIPFAVSKKGFGHQG